MNKNNLFKNMDTNEKINLQTLNTLKRDSETHTPIKSYENYKNSNSNDHKKNSHKKLDSKRHKKRRLSPDVKKMKKINSNKNIKNSPKFQPNHHKSSKLKSYFFEENKFCYKEKTKSQDKKIKINLVSLKFKIADDFNEKNSNQFLKEKDECLKAIILSDKIEEEKAIPFYVESGKGSIYEISSIKQNEDEDSLNKRKIKRKKYKNDSTNLLFELVYSLK